VILHKKVNGLDWSIVYDKAIRDDGSLLFPSRLSQEYLDGQKKIQGSYIFAHQYQNEIIPSDDQDFKRSWLKYFTELPKYKTTFAFIDPAISLEDQACYTALCVIDVDEANNWYLKVAKRLRITATQTIDLIFKVHEMFRCQAIGVEIVAYQEALMHFLDTEMKRRRITIPVHGVKRSSDQSKMLRIRSLVPRFEWGRILVKQGLSEFEDEYLKFPRGTYVDILDALSSLEELAYPPDPKQKDSKDLAANHPDYEKQYIRKLYEKRAREAEEAE
jgi:predicted phage terminase large subunit-like protein